MRVCAFVSDLMDRSRLSAAVAGIEFGREVGACAGAETVVIDLARHADLVERVRALAPAARIVAFAPHVDDATMDRARAAGADVVLPRSRFFRDVAKAVDPA